MLSINDHFCQVGRLFYAIAICDGKLHPSEMLNLKDGLNAYNQYLRNTYHTTIYTASFYIEDVLSTIVDEGLDSWAYFGKFKDYFEQHRDEFTDEQKDLILSKVKEIGSSYAKQNKSELVLIARTNLLFKSD
ncbi:MAG: hypothetical protein ACR2MM_00665 [Flavobacteriaceae bacterium]